jgi:hypothetical protein
MHELTRAIKNVNAGSLHIKYAQYGTKKKYKTAQIRQINVDINVLKL